MKLVEKEVLKAFRDAYEAAADAATVNTEDGGTCNLDAIEVSLPRWRESLVECLAEVAGFSAWKHRPGVFVLGASFGMANRQQRAMEAGAKALKARGLSARVWYQMD